MSARALVAAAALRLAAAAGSGSWVLRWHDEFDGPAVNQSNWNIINNTSECGMPGCTGNQIELYDADNVFIEGGALVLRTRLQQVVTPGFTFNVTSGRVDTMHKVNVTYGRVEVSAKLQHDEAFGIHTAHWMIGYECWPVGAEIDIMEMQSPGNIYAGVGGGDTCGSHWAKATSNYHYNTPGHCGKDIPHHTGVSEWPPAPMPSVNFTAYYTTYAVEWNATDLVYFVNATVVNHVYVGMPGWAAPGAAIPSWPMFIILSQAYMSHRPCGNPPAWAWPVHQYIDYVRVYEWAAGGDSVGAGGNATAAA